MNARARWVKAARRIAIAVLLLAAAGAWKDVHGQSTNPVSSADLRDMVLEYAVPSPDELPAADVNGDGVVDAADLVRQARCQPVNVEGLWLAVVTLRNASDSTGAQGPLLATPVSYSVFFSLSSGTGGAMAGTVRAARGYDPLRPLLNQIGNGLRGTRPVFAPSQFAPTGFPVTAAYDANRQQLAVTLEGVPAGSLQVTGAQPLALPMTRDVHLVFREVPMAGGVADGVALEATMGLHASSAPAFLTGPAVLMYCGNDDGAVAPLPSPTPSSEPAALLANSLPADGMPKGAGFAPSGMDAGSAALAAADIRDAAGFRLVSALAPYSTLAWTPPSPVPPPPAGLLLVRGQYDNRLASTGAAWNPGQAFAGGGGAVFTGGAGETGACAGAVLRCGQPVAGQAYMTASEAALSAAAAAALNASTAFISSSNILRGTGTLHEPGDFDADGVLVAERTYAGLVAAQPFSETGVLGILEGRIRMATAYNLMADHSLLDLHKYKYLMPQDTSGYAILGGEIGILDQALSNSWRAAQVMLSLFADRQTRGAGAYLRRELSPAVPGGPLDARLAASVRMGTESVRRFAEIRLLRAEKLLALSFYQPSERNQAMEELLALESYLTEASRVLGLAGDLYDYGASGAGVLASCIEQTRILKGRIQSGQNHLGFDPNFVPFLEGNDLTDQRSTVRKLMDFASSVVDLAAQDEAATENSQTQFTDDQAAYLHRVEDLRTSAFDRLKALCGVIENPAPGSDDPTYQPDLYTFLEPSSTGRTAMLHQWLPGWNSLSLGQINIQFQNIENAHTRIQQAINEMNNLVQEMEIHEATAQTIASNYDFVAELHLSTGQQVGLLVRQKGILRQQAAVAAANAERKRSRLLLGAQTVVAAVSGMATVVSPQAALSSMSGGGSAQGAVSLADGFSQYKNIMDQSRLSGDLAVAEANIDSAIEELRAMEAAQVVYAQKREMLARNEEQLRILALRQANLALSIQVAQRDAIKEEMQLANMVSEVLSLMAEISRQLRQERDLNAGSWYQDWRAVYYACQSDAEDSFRWAQGACFMALRALDYHLNASQDLTGSYQLLYRARTTRHLRTLLTNMEQSLTLANLASSPPGQALLSLKYDILSRQAVGLDTNGWPTATPGDEAFSYVDPVDGQALRGALAQQARLRDFLKAHLTRTAIGGGQYRYELAFDFETDLLPAAYAKQMPDGSFLPTRENPFWDSGLTVNQVVLGQVFAQYPESSTYQGTVVNMTGTGLPAINACKVRLSMAGNLYQRVSYVAGNATTGLVMYSTYNQQFPASLKLPGDTAPPPMQSFSSVRTAVCSAQINGRQVGSVNPRVLAFTDRAVACDRWSFRMTSDDGNGNPEFLGTLYSRVNQAAADFTYVTDIQFKVGWIAKFTQPQ